MPKGFHSNTLEKAKRQEVEKIFILFNHSLFHYKILYNLQAVLI